MSSRSTKPRGFLLLPIPTTYSTLVMTTLTTSGLLVALFILVVYLKQRRHHLPPGPKGLPLIGSALEVPKGFEWIVYKQWSRKYGTVLSLIYCAMKPTYHISRDVTDSDILHFKIFQTNVIILNSAAAVRDLLEKRSNIYSDR